VSWIRERLNVHLLLSALFDQIKFHLGQVQQLVADPDFPAKQTYPDWAHSGELVRLLEVLWKLGIADREPLSRPGHVFQRPANPADGELQAANIAVAPFGWWLELLACPGFELPKQCEQLTPPAQALNLLVIGGLLHGAGNEDAIIARVTQLDGRVFEAGDHHLASEQLFKGRAHASPPAPVKPRLDSVRGESPN